MHFESVFANWPNAVYLPKLNAFNIVLASQVWTGTEHGGGGGRDLCTNDCAFRSVL